MESKLKLRNPLYCNGCELLSIGNPPCHCIKYKEYREIVPLDKNGRKFLHIRSQQCIDDHAGGLVADSAEKYKPTPPEPRHSKSSVQPRKIGEAPKTPKAPRIAPPKPVTPKAGSELKILWLYRYAPHYDFDKWLHMEFAKAIKEHDGIDLMAYGLNLHQGYPDLAPISYNKHITLQKIHECFPFDVIICNTKSRMFENYLPPNYPFSTQKGYEVNPWLPSDFKDWECPKIMIEEDYHYELNDDWYFKNRFDLILQRHYPHAKRGENVKMIWFPFSVDTKLFCPKSIERVRKVCFVGSCTNAYPHRKEVSLRLSKVEPIFKDYKNILHGQDYIDNLSGYISHLCCSSMFNITPAKLTEIMASGSLLFTNNNNEYGLQKLFPEGSYITYEEDYSDVVEKARWAVDNGPERDAMIAKGLECINKKHTHQIRIDELREIIRKEFKI